jgi:hypothetical protein
MHTPTRHRPPPARNRWGSLPARSGVWIIVLSAALGLTATVVANREPGDLLGVFLIAGTLLAAIAVRPKAVHMIIPAPALAFLTASVIAGLVHDRATDVTLTAVTVSGLQWIAGGFLAMTAATLLAIALTAARRLRARGPASRRRRGPVGSGEWDVGR